MGKLVKRIEHGKRFKLRPSKHGYLCKPVKKRGVKNGSRNSRWEMVIEECVDQGEKQA